MTTEPGAWIILIPFIGLVAAGVAELAHRRWKQSGRSLVERIADYSVVRDRTL